MPNSPCSDLFRLYGRARALFSAAEAGPEFLFENRSTVSILWGKRQPNQPDLRESNYLARARCDGERRGVVTSGVGFLADSMRKCVGTGGKIRFSARSATRRKGRNCHRTRCHAGNHYFHGSKRLGRISGNDGSASCTRLDLVCPPASSSRTVRRATVGQSNYENSPSHPSA